MARQMRFDAPKPESVDPIEVTLSGYYQSDPHVGEDSPEGFDWRTAQWTETVQFVAHAPWNEVNRVIRSVAQDSEGNLIVAASLDLSRFLIDNGLTQDDRRRISDLISDRDRVLDQKTLAKVVFGLLGEWGGRPTTPSHG